MSIERPSWADFTAVWSASRSAPVVHVRSGASFDGTVRTQCGRELKRPEEQHATRSELDDNSRSWCEKCRTIARKRL